MNSCPKVFSACMLATVALLVGASPAWAQGADFTVLGNAAVTCTGGIIIGEVGTNQSPTDSPPGSVTQTICSINGIVDDPNNVHVGDAAAKAAFSDFVSTYEALEDVACDETLTGTLAGVKLSPGVYCFDAAATLTGTLTLAGGTNATWLFKIGTGGTGALTGTNFSVVMANGAPVSACNVTWWVAEAATMTTSDFNGTILAGAAITTTGGTFNGDAFAQADVTITGTVVTGCEGGSIVGREKSKCNQGVGNGSEGCDPGNSNQDDHGSNPFVGSTRTNDELGGTPGEPGKQDDNQ